ncbi:MAG TPA: hypothetical protein VJ248_05160, partial [Candidatus Udaeobacter sp.]|nr:hypothetical protein [Candidatus Udaeobacter sp.]
MKSVVGRRKFAPNPSEERWTPAFPVSNKGKKQAAWRQKNYCYVCVAKKATAAKLKMERVVFNALAKQL